MESATKFNENFFNMGAYNYRQFRIFISLLAKCHIPYFNINLFDK